MINGDLGWLGWCTTPDGAYAAAVSAADLGAEGVVVHRGETLSVVRVWGGDDALGAVVGARCDLAWYRTATRHVLRHVRTWPDGAVTPGVTMLFSIHRRPGMAVEAFHQWWEQSHAPIALRHHVGMWDYAQVSVVETLRGEPMDGFAVTQWPTLDDLMHRFSSGPDGTDALRYDAAQFTDPNTLRRHLLDEQVLVAAPWPITGDLAVGMARSVDLDEGEYAPPIPLPDGVSLDVRPTAQGLPRLDMLWRTTATADRVSELPQRFEEVWRRSIAHLGGRVQASSSS